eukprot:Em0007g267a
MSGYVLVPRGWQREVTEQSVEYISPDHRRLSSRDELLLHLTSTGTCKCGLQCPFKFDDHFNFDPDVISLPDSTPGDSSLCRVPHRSSLDPVPTTERVEEHCTPTKQQRPSRRTKPSEKACLAKANGFAQGEVAIVASSGKSPLSSPNVVESSLDKMVSRRDGSKMVTSFVAVTLTGSPSSPSKSSAAPSSSEGVSNSHDKGGCEMVTLLIKHPLRSTRHLKLHKPFKNTIGLEKVAGLRVGGDSCHDNTPKAVDVKGEANGNKDVACSKLSSVGLDLATLQEYYGEDHSLLMAPPPHTINSTKTETPAPPFLLHGQSQSPDWYGIQKYHPGDPGTATTTSPSKLGGGVRRVEQQPYGGGNAKSMELSACAPRLSHLVRMEQLASGSTPSPTIPLPPPHPQPLAAQNGVGKEQPSPPPPPSASFLSQGLSKLPPRLLQAAYGFGEGGGGGMTHPQPHHHAPPLRYLKSRTGTSRHPRPSNQVGAVGTMKGGGGVGGVDATTTDKILTATGVRANPAEVCAPPIPVTAMPTQDAKERSLLLSAVDQSSSGLKRSSASGEGDQVVGAIGGASVNGGAGVNSGANAGVNSSANGGIGAAGRLEERGGKKFRTNSSSSTQDAANSPNHHVPSPRCHGGSLATPPCLQQDGPLGLCDSMDSFSTSLEQPEIDIETILRAGMEPGPDECTVSDIMQGPLPAGEGVVMDYSSLMSMMYHASLVVAPDNDPNQGGMGGTDSGPPETTDDSKPLLLEAEGGGTEHGDKEQAASQAAPSEVPETKQPLPDDGQCNGDYVGVASARGNGCLSADANKDITVSLSDPKDDDGSHTSLQPGDGSGTSAPDHQSNENTVTSSAVSPPHPLPIGQDTGKTCSIAVPGDRKAASAWPGDGGGREISTDDVGGIPSGDVGHNSSGDVGGIPSDVGGKPSDNVGGNPSDDVGGNPSNGSRRASFQDPGSVMCANSHQNGGEGGKSPGYGDGSSTLSSRQGYLPTHLQCDTTPLPPEDTFASSPPPPSRSQVYSLTFHVSIDDSMATLPEPLPPLSADHISCAHPISATSSPRGVGGVSLGCRDTFSPEMYVVRTGAQVLSSSPMKVDVARPMSFTTRVSYCSMDPPPDISPPPLDPPDHVSTLSLYPPDQVSTTPLHPPDQVVVPIPEHATNPSLALALTVPSDGHVISPSLNPLDHVISPSLNPLDHVISPSLNPLDHVISPSLNPLDHVISPSLNPPDHVTPLSPGAPDHMTRPSLDPPACVIPIPPRTCDDMLPQPFPPSPPHPSGAPSVTDAVPAKPVCFEAVVGVPMSARDDAINIEGHVTDRTGHVTDSMGHVTDSTGHVTDSTGHVTDRGSHVTDGGVGCSLHTRPPSPEFPLYARPRPLEARRKKTHVSRSHQGEATSHSDTDTDRVLVPSTSDRSNAERHQSLETTTSVVSSDVQAGAPGATPSVDGMVTSAANPKTMTRSPVGGGVIQLLSNDALNCPPLPIATGVEVLVPFDLPRVSCDTLYDSPHPPPDLSHSPCDPLHAPSVSSCSPHNASPPPCDPPPCDPLPCDLPPPPCDLLPPPCDLPPAPCDSLPPPCDPPPPCDLPHPPCDLPPLPCDLLPPPCDLLPPPCELPPLPPCDSLPSHPPPTTPLDVRPGIIAGHMYDTDTPCCNEVTGIATDMLLGNTPGPIDTSTKRDVTLGRSRAPPTSAPPPKKRRRVVKHWYPSKKKKKKGGGKKDVCTPGDPLENWREVETIAHGAEDAAMATAGVWWEEPSVTQPLSTSSRKKSRHPSKAPDHLDLSLGVAQHVTVGVAKGLSSGTRSQSQGLMTGGGVPHPPPYPTQSAVTRNRAELEIAEIMVSQLATPLLTTPPIGFPAVPEDGCCKDKTDIGMASECPPNVGVATPGTAATQGCRSPLHSTRETEGHQPDAEMVESRLSCLSPPLPPSPPVEGVYFSTAPLPLSPPSPPSPPSQRLPPSPPSQSVVLSLRVCPSSPESGHHHAPSLCEDKMAVPCDREVGATPSDLGENRHQLLSPLHLSLDAPLSRVTDLVGDGGVESEVGVAAVLKEQDGHLGNSDVGVCPNISDVGVCPNISDTGASSDSGVCPNISGAGAISDAGVCPNISDAGVCPNISGAGAISDAAGVKCITQEMHSAEVDTSQTVVKEGSGGDGGSGHDNEGCGGTLNDSVVLPLAEVLTPTAPVTKRVECLLHLPTTATKDHQPSPQPPSLVPDDSLPLVPTTTDHQLPSLAVGPWSSQTLGTEDTLPPSPSTLEVTASFPLVHTLPSATTTTAQSQQPIHEDQPSSSTVTVPQHMPSPSTTTPDNIQLPPSTAESQQPSGTTESQQFPGTTEFQQPPGTTEFQQPPGTTEFQQPPGTTESHPHHSPTIGTGHLLTSPTQEDNPRPLREELLTTQLSPVAGRGQTPPATLESGDSLSALGGEPLASGGEPSRAHKRKRHASSAAKGVTAKKLRLLVSVPLSQVKIEHHVIIKCYPSFGAGDVVWARAHLLPEWPGTIIESWGSKEQLPPDKVWVRWFGDNTVSVVNRSTLKLLEEGVDKMMAEGKGKGKLSKKLEVAILEAQAAEKLLQEKKAKMLQQQSPAKLL